MANGARNRLPTRREALSAALAGASLWAANSTDTGQATGVKVGEVTPTSAVIWTRRTQSARRLDGGVRRRGSGKEAFPLKAGEDVNTLEGACPGSAGFVRVTLEAQSGPHRKRVTPWVAVGDDTDFAHPFRMDGLLQATE